MLNQVAEEESYRNKLEKKHTSRERRNLIAINISCSRKINFETYDVTYLPMLSENCNALL